MVDIKPVQLKKKKKKKREREKERKNIGGKGSRRLVVVHVIYSGTMRGRGDKDTDASWATTIHEFVNRIFPPVPRVHGYDTVTSRESREVPPPSLHVPLPIIGRLTRNVYTVGIN